MNKVKLVSPLLLVLVLVGVLAVACGGGGIAKLRASDVAVVGHTHVTKGQFDSLLAQAKQNFQQQGRKFPKQGTADYLAVQGQVVSLLVQQAEREEQAKAMGIHVSQQDVDKRLALLKKQYFGGSDKTYHAQLRRYHMTQADFIHAIRVQLISEAIYKQLTDGVKVSDDEVHRYYVEHAQDYRQGKTRDVRYILVGKDKQTAEAVYRQLKGGGTSTWCKLAKRYAKDASGQNCGKATFTQGQTVPVFDKAAFSTPAHVVHKPFYDPTQYKAWFVMEPLGPVKKATTTPESQVAATIRQTLLQRKQDQAVADWSASLRKHYCSGRIAYQVGYSANPDPCASTTTTTTTG